jgi:hypothetical protein
MPSTCTPGITFDAAGQRIIDKEHRGVRIYIRLGSIDEEAARQRLASEMEHVEATLQQRAARPRFADAAARYLEESQHLRSADATAWHIRLLTPYTLGHLSSTGYMTRRLSGSSPIDAPRA